MKCGICPHKCEITNEHHGFCKSKTLSGERIVSNNYGEVTAFAFDPIEKKPLNMFMPGRGILSVSLWGCNMRCPWCQNDSISRGRAPFRKMTPQDIAASAQELKNRGNIGVAFTYNEPFICPDFILDTAKLVRAAGMKNVLVTNGMASDEVLNELLPYIDALNIDLKCFSASRYKKIGGDLETVKNTIIRSSETSHVEVTTLIVPGFNDTVAEIDAIADFIAGVDKKIPLHVTRFYPAGDMTDTPPTPVRTVHGLAERARERLEYVFTGNC